MRSLLQRLAKEDPPAFICHFYNIYFAHSAGGRMIGRSHSLCLPCHQTFMLISALVIHSRQIDVPATPHLPKFIGNCTKICRCDVIIGNKHDQRPTFRASLSDKFSFII